jgi:hypothetical protein
VEALPRADQPKGEPLDLSPVRPPESLRAVHGTVDHRPDQPHALLGFDRSMGRLALG